MNAFLLFFVACLTCFHIYFSVSFSPIVTSDVHFPAYIHLYFSLAHLYLPMSYVTCICLFSACPYLTQYDDTLLQGGLPVLGTNDTLDECAQYCLRDPDCKAVDYDLTSKRCTIHKKIDNETNHESTSCCVHFKKTDDCETGRVTLNGTVVGSHGSRDDGLQGSREEKHKTVTPTMASSTTTPSQNNENLNTKSTTTVKQITVTIKTKTEPSTEAESKHKSNFVTINVGERNTVTSSTNTAYTSTTERTSTTENGPLYENRGEGGSENEDGIDRMETVSMEEIVTPTNKGEENSEHQREDSNNENTTEYSTRSEVTSTTQSSSTDEDPAERTTITPSQSSKNTTLSSQSVKNVTTATITTTTTAEDIPEGRNTFYLLLCNIYTCTLNILHTYAHALQCFNC